jgi:hypothetical protein
MLEEYRGRYKRLKFGRRISRLADVRFGSGSALRQVVFTPSTLKDAQHFSSSDRKDQMPLQTPKT